MLAVVDTSPINYLVLIGQIDILPALARRIVVPGAVMAELRSIHAPMAVRKWIGAMPAWLEVHHLRPAVPVDPLLDLIDAGEREAIQVAFGLSAALLVMDDRKGVLAAREKGIRVTGTLGLLDMAARIAVSSISRIRFAG